MNHFIGILYYRSRIGIPLISFFVGNQKRRWEGNIIDIMQAVKLRDDKLRNDILERIKSCPNPAEQKKLWLEWESLLPEESASEPEKKVIKDTIQQNEFISEEDLLKELGDLFPRF